MLTYYNNFVPLVQLKTINMPRQARKTSGTGIYHVMLRGINRQDIFEDDEDYMKFLQSLHQLVECYDERRIQTTGTNNGHQLRDYPKSSNRSENRPLIYSEPTLKIARLLCATLGIPPAAMLGL